MSTHIPYAGDIKFAKCLKIVLGHEGGFADNPNDPGGPTNKGITLETYRRFFGSKMTVGDLKYMDKNQLRHIYMEGYWKKVWGDDLPNGIDLVAFDAAVHSGASQSVKFVQRAVLSKEDGFMGPKTLAAIRSRDSLRVITDSLAVRLEFLKSLRHSDHFPGWQVRIVNVFNQALRLMDTTSK